MIKSLMASLLLIALAGWASAQCCGGGVWDPSEFLNSDVPVSASTGSSQSGAAKAAAYRSGDYPGGDHLLDMMVVSSSDLLIEASAPDLRHAKGAVNIQAKDFLDQNGKLKSPEEMAAILGNKGVLAKDSVVVYGEPGDATFLVWVLRYLGHEDVSLMDGGMGDWRSASLPLEEEYQDRAAVVYDTSVRGGLLADSAVVTAPGNQVVDARRFQEYAEGKIPGAINIPSERVFEGSRVKDATSLEQAFAALDKDKSVVVYGDGFSGSPVWYALWIMGYDSKLYTWEDWQSVA